MKLFNDHLVWLVVSLAMVLIVVLVLSLTGHPVDDRLISGGVLFLVGAIAGLAKSSPPDA